MPIKTQKKAQTDKTRTAERQTALPTAPSDENDSSATTTTAKRSADQRRSKSEDPKVHSGASKDVGSTSQGTKRTQLLKMISEVDETNDDDVFISPGPSNPPKAFFTEIQQEQVYENILHELQKRKPHRSPSSAPTQESRLEHGIQQEQPLSSVDVEIKDDGEEIIENAASVSGEALSSASSDNEDLPQEDNYDTDIESETITHEDHDITGRTQYREFCLQSKLIPCSYFMAHIQDKEMTLRYHQFSTEDIRAIAKTLCSNLNVERLLLDGNYLQRHAAKYISRMIVVNDFITELSLADNQLGGGEGTKEICKMLTLNRYLKKINLSGNRFSDVDAPHLVEAFEQSKVLRELDLSHNFFGDTCGKALGAYISGNDSLESIDLSWNNIRGRSAVDIAHGIKENVRLKRCNIEMNGFGPEGGLVLADCIKHNGALEEFNISANRINSSNAFAIAVGLLSNDSLQVLKIADNQINSDGALAIFLCIKANESSVVREVDFSHTVITQEAFDVCEDIVNLRGGKFHYRTGKVTPKILKSNSISECYTRTNEQLLNKLRTNANNAKAHPP